MERMAEELSRYLRDGLAISESVKRLPCWRVLNSGSGVDSGLRSGSGGSGARRGLPSCANGMWAKT